LEVEIISYVVLSYWHSHSFPTLHRMLQIFLSWTYLNHAPWRSPMARMTLWALRFLSGQMKDIICNELSLKFSLCISLVSLLYDLKNCIISFLEMIILLNTLIRVWRGGTFLFSFQVSPIYPHEAPKVKCKTKVFY